MSDRPITFTEQEQLKLQELERQAQGFANFKNAVTRSMHSGQDSSLIAQLLQFLHDMAVQSANQIDDLRKTAQQRSNKPAEQDALKDKKDSKKKDK